MARSLRIEFPGAFSHVTSRGNERNAIYRDRIDRQQFLTAVAEVVDHFYLLLHAYPNTRCRPYKDVSPKRRAL